MRVVRTAIVAALIIGCGRDSSAPGVINGTYTLRTLRNEPLPTVVQEHLNYALTVTAGSVTINGDLTFSDTYSFHEYDAGVITDETIPCTGHWAPSGEASTRGNLLITLTEDAIPGCADHGVGEWDGGNQLTIAWNSIGTGVHKR
jgi:hypothetical protein